MAAETKWNELIEEHEIAYLRGDLATSSPESYTIEEMREISEGMFESTAKVEAAMRADFQAMPPHAQRLMLDMLGKPGSPERAWRDELLTASSKPLA